MTMVSGIKNKKLTDENVPLLTENCQASKASTDNSIASRVTR